MREKVCALLYEIALDFLEERLGGQSTKIVTMTFVH